MSGWSWAWVSAIVLAVAACESAPGELSSKGAVVPEPPYGVVVGVAVAGRTPLTDANWVSRRNDIYLRYQHQAGPFGELLIVREYLPLGGTFTGTENGMPLTYRPFAMRMPAGQGEFGTFGNRHTISKWRQEERRVDVLYKDRNGQWQTKSEWKTERVYAPIHVANASFVPAARFEVAPGKVRYIGRFGVLVHSIEPSGSRPLQCSIGQLEQISEHEHWCLARELFTDSAPEADLAMIRQRFPKLAKAEIEVRPVQFGSDGWQDFAQAAGRFGGGF